MPLTLAVLCGSHDGGSVNCSRALLTTAPASLYLGQAPLLTGEVLYCMCLFHQCVLQSLGYFSWSSTPSPALQQEAASHVQVQHSLLFELLQLWGHSPSSFYRMPFCSTSPRLCRPSDMTRYVLTQHSSYFFQELSVLLLQLTQAPSGLPQKQDCAVTTEPLFLLPHPEATHALWRGRALVPCLTVSYGWAACSRVPFVGSGLSKSYNLPESGCCPRKVVRLRWADKRYVLITLHRKWQQPDDLTKTFTSTQDESACHRNLTTESNHWSHGGKRGPTVELSSDHHMHTVAFLHSHKHKIINEMKKKKQIHFTSCGGTHL